MGNCVAAVLTMPEYAQFNYGMTPEQFIKHYWNDATNEVREHMIEYIEEYPFDGSDKYVGEWKYHLRNTYGLIN